MSAGWDGYALLLIDVQGDFYSPALGSTRNGYADRVAGLLDLCRTTGLPVVHAHARFAADGSDWMARYLLRDWTPCIEGTPGVGVCDFAEPRPAEPVVVKRSFDAFLQTDLDAILRGLGCEVLLVAGLVTSTCVLLSAATATQLGYLVTVVEDCCADELDRHEATLASYPFVFDRVRVAGITDRKPDWDAQREELHAAGRPG